MIIDCPDCDGDGFVEDDFDGLSSIHCETCDGAGEVNDEDMEDNGISDS